MSPSKMKQSQEDVTSQNFDFQKVYFELLQFMKQKWNIYLFVQFPKLFLALIALPKLFWPPSPPPNSGSLVDLTTKSA